MPNLSLFHEQESLRRMDALYFKLVLLADYANLMFKADTRPDDMQSLAVMLNDMVGEALTLRERAQEATEVRHVAQ